MTTSRKFESFGKRKRIYSRIGRIQCPALNKRYVSFSRNGFDHLMYKNRGRVPRPKVEQKKRFVLLKYAEKIITNPKATILYREKEIKRRTSKTNKYGKNILITSKAQFWTFVDEVGSCRIKVVVVKINNGIEKFCSIMGDNVQTKKRKKPIKKPLKK